MIVKEKNHYIGGICMSSRRKLMLFIAMSLDGYIAGKDESLDWLFKVEGEGDNGYSKFYDTVDTVLMGRKTYDWLLKHVDGTFPYEGKECFVFSRSLGTDNSNVNFVSADIVSFTNLLKEKDGKNIWLVGGGNLLQTFLQEDLVDEIILTLAPTVIGNGIPLFQQSDKEIELSLMNMSQYNQFVELHYEVKK